MTDTAEQICSSCYRNGSPIWWKCCPTHMSPTDSHVVCYACAQKLHPEDPEFKLDIPEEEPKHTPWTCELCNAIWIPGHKLCPYCGHHTRVKR